MSKDAALSIDLAALPDDAALLKRFIVEERRQRAALIAQIREEVAAQLERIRQEAAAQLEAQAERHAAEMKAAIQALLRRYYGPRSEKFDPRQLLLFGQTIDELPRDEASVAAEAGEKLVELMIARVKQSRVIHTDDTPVPIQSPGAKRCRQGRIWCYLGDVSHPYTVYDYTPDRSRAGPARWLAGYRGYLQADAYGGYDGVFAGGDILEVACWAHARRKFFDAQDSDTRRAAEMLALVGELYAIEREAQDADEAARLALRQARSAPALARIATWLDAEGEIVLPRSPMATAIGYARNQWTALTTYTTQGFLNIDNNASERALKRVALGRKNWRAPEVPRRYSGRSPPRDALLAMFA